LEPGKGDNKGLKQASGESGAIIDHNTREGAQGREMAISTKNSIKIIGARESRDGGIFLNSTIGLGATRGITAW